ncbi:MAG TPA: hypothetical protein PK151_07840 [Caldisericia bacterium]|nr:hypothetical protein [Caldisericia bacterium]
MKELREKIDELTKKRLNLKEQFDILFDTMGELEINEPSFALSHFGTKFLRLLKDYTTLKSKIAIWVFEAKNRVKTEEAIFKLKKREELELNGKKTTEGLLEDLVNADNNLNMLKSSKNTLEVLLSVVEDEINLLIEIIQMIKKVADVKSLVNVKLATNFEVGE